MGETNQENGCFLGHVSCTTFNILAPIYKRLNDKTCESEFPELWISRNESILDKLLEIKSSIICLQEFWVGNEELVQMYEKRLGEAGYKTYKLARTNNRGDGLLAAVHQNSFHVLNYKDCVINGIGDRVAQLFDVELVVPPEDQIHKSGIRTILVNTHLIFPHEYIYCFARLKQVYKILQFIESYCKESKLSSIPIILCGDWNGSMKGNVCRFLLSQGFVSAYDIAHPSLDHTVDNCKWVSHHNHRGNICAVDFVWIHNPNNLRKPLKQSFMEALLRNIYELQSKVTESIYALPFPRVDLSSVTCTQFSETLTKLKLIGPPFNVFTAEEIKDFWDHIDSNGDGVIDMSDFSQQQGMHTEQAETQSEETDDALTTMSPVGFNVVKAMLFPGEVEQVGFLG
ncbi:EF-Hand 1, calcium-binding site protein [Heracleum sosnowskyi]|uniref:EF-Hand 1, calcium-binding site protein n=1 Tax=Heracleum sosnowskyi TaxID=360622 RepID=A0AAD8ICA5_9APIA|nr:EF-Hand 1, calcium-binding site protein [Heracleum sosnowskyi]